MSLVNLKMVKREFLSPADLIKAQAFYIYELMRVVLIHEDENLKFAFLQIVMPNLKYLKNG